MSKDQELKRRDFITTTLAGGLGLGLFIFSGVGEVLAATTRKQTSKVEPEEAKVGKLKNLTIEKGKKPPKCQRKRNPKCGGTFIAH